jgi:phage terminase small subunit
VAAKKRVKAGTSKVSAARRRELFVEAYVTNGGNATQAAISAGFPVKSASSRGHEYVKDREIFAEIERRRAETLADAKEITGLSVERTLREVARLAYFDPRKLYHEDGRLKAIHELDDDTAAAVASVEVDEIGVEGTVIGHTKKIKHWDKNAALEKAMKHLGQYEADNDQKPPAAEIHLPGVKSVKFVPLRDRGR